MKQQTNAKTEVVPWEKGEFGVITTNGAVWRGYAVGSREDAYEELKRLEKEGVSDHRPRH